MALIVQGSHRKRIRTWNIASVLIPKWEEQFTVCIAGGTGRQAAAGVNTVTKNLVVVGAVIL